MRGGTMSYPGRGPMYRRCIMCGRPFRIRRWQLGRESRASSAPCGATAHPGRAFSNALADGRLELILAEERERAKRDAIC
jgi:hypothetical protein